MEGTSSSLPQQLQLTLNFDHDSIESFYMQSFLIKIIARLLSVP